MISLTIFALSMVIAREYYLFSKIALIFLIIAEIISFVAYTNRANKDLAYLINSFRSGFPEKLKINDKLDANQKRLYAAINQLSDDFNNLRINRELDFQLFQNIIHHVGIGIIVLDNEGGIILSNKAFHSIFKIEHVVNIKDLCKFHTALPDYILRISPIKPELKTFISRTGTQHLSMKASEIVLNGKMLKLVSFQNINNEIEQKEIEAWQKLMRVINHEIINSMSPVELLSSSMIKKLEKLSIDNNKDNIIGSEIEKLKNDLRIINTRSSDLTKFVVAYRSSMNVPQPVMKNVIVVDLIRDLESLFKETLDSKGINFSISVRPKTIMLKADKKMIEQVLINLIKNSIQAVENIKVPVIEFNCKYKDGNVVIEVIDNGMGIPGEIADNLFMPFFTTRPGGSGIGLNISKKIINLHNGTIDFFSTRSKTCFNITLPKNQP